MAFASHLGPWLLGTVKNTTGTVAGQIRNMGATIVAQQAPVTYTDGTASVAFVIPAGASILAVDLFQNVAFTSGGTGTVTVYVNGTAITGAITISTGSTGKQSLAIGTTNPTLVTNVGSTDAIITYTFGTVTAGSGIISATYIVRGSDGSANPSQV